MKLDLSKLKKMKMPESKKAAPPEAEMEAGDEEMAMDEEMSLELPELGEEEGADYEAAESLEEETGESEPLDLTALSDEELMAELQKRGLMSKMKA